MEEFHLTCRSCGQHFETKSDLKDHEKTCQGVGVGQSQGKTQNPGLSRQQQGDRTRKAGSGGREESGG